MPLIKSASKKAVSENIGKEMSAGKPHKQSIAIALSVQRQAKKKHPKKMADGGEVTAADKIAQAFGHPDAGPKPSPTPEPKNYAMGGEVSSDEHYDSIAEAIMRKKHSEKMSADDGLVDLEEGSEEHPNLYDELNADAGDAEQHDLSQLSPQPEDSNELGDSNEEDSENEHDHIDAMRKKIMAKSR